MKLSETLKYLMTREGITLGQLAKTAEIPTSTLHGWLNGIEPKNLSQLKKVSDFFGVTIDYLCFGSQMKDDQKSAIVEYEDEIKAGVFEVVLRKIKKP